MRTVIFLLILISIGGYLAFMYKDYLRETMDNPERLPKIRPLAKDIDALDQNGNPFSFKMLKGKVWVMSAFYTDWNTPVPGKDVMDRMRDLARIYEDEEEFHIVAISVDPAVDRPEVIKDWLRKNDFNPRAWTFVTGEEKTIRSYLLKYFQYQVVKQKDTKLAEEHGDWVHSAAPVLVDREGWIRGENYGITDPEKGGSWFKKLQMDIDKQLESGREAETVKEGGKPEDGGNAGTPSKSGEG